ncbi:MAG: maleylpyruvate isomerase N-terminal domain-containing protein [Actinomycetota bacterium]
MSPAHAATVERQLIHARIVPPRSEKSAYGPHMVAHALNAPYEALLAEAAGGGFVDPPEGWTAAMILAHVAINDRLLAAVTKAVTEGHSPPYDNAPAINSAQLRAYADRTGWDGLLDEVRSGADALMAAAAAMTAEQGQRLVDSRIVDAGNVVMDDAVPWLRILMVHGQNHLPAHRRQLAALRR